MKRFSVLIGAGVSVIGVLLLAFFLIDRGYFSSNRTNDRFTDLVMYHVYLPAFFDGDRKNNTASVDKEGRYGDGDLQGLIQKMDHIRSLGMNAIFMSPPFRSHSAHGYDVLDYFSIGEHVGVPGDPAASLELFRKTVSEAHAHGLKLILDLPLNHVYKDYRFPEGDPHGFKPKFTDAETFEEKNWQNAGNNLAYWDLSDKKTREFLIDVALNWVDEGVDGLRLDYVAGVPVDFWRELYAAVKARKANLYVIGEVWPDRADGDENRRRIAEFYAREEGVQFDSLFEIPFALAVRNAFAKGGSLVPVEETLERSEKLYPQGSLPAYFFESHDITRFMDWTGDYRRFVAATGLMAGLSGPQSFFYGGEAGLRGSVVKEGFTPTGRIPMRFDDATERNAKLISAIYAARAESAALRSGTRHSILAEDRALIMEKRSATDTAFVGVNLDEKERIFSFRVGTSTSSASLRSLFGSSSFSADKEGTLTWKLPPVSTSIIGGPRRTP